MTLIKSISGIRGTIGGQAGEGLSPVDIVKFVSAYGMFIKECAAKKRISIVVGRDARISGVMVDHIVCGTLMSIGANVINLGLASTPTVEIAVTEENADGGIILTASHNPKQWNALKLLNNKGEFLSAKDGEKILEIASGSSVNFSSVDDLGKIVHNTKYNQVHIQKILQLPLVNKKAIESARFKIAIDCVNSVGGIIIPELLKSLGVKEVYLLNCEADGHFAHNPEPLPENLIEISKTVVNKKADLGIVVDPDVDRLAIINEDGTMFGEEYTLVAVADYILQNKPGNTVSNLSSTRALRDVTEHYKGTYFASAVGEVNVVEQMKTSKAVIGGEGNGGVIYPDLHYGRDALVGIVLFLTALAKSKLSCSDFKKKFPEYQISKNKIELTPETDIDKILETIKNTYKKERIDEIDGVRIDFEATMEWVHLRKSNTEPIIRIYAESKTTDNAQKLAQKIISEITQIIKSQN